MRMLLALALFLSATTAHANLSVGVSKKYARVIYDVAQNGGESVSHDLDAVLPANAIITNQWIYINTAFTDSGTGSLAFECGATRNLMDWQDATSFAQNDVYAVNRSQTTFNSASATFILAGQAPAAAGIASVPAACSFKAVVRSDSGYVPLLTGKATLLTEYFQP